MTAWAMSGVRPRWLQRTWPLEVVQRVDGRAVDAYLEVEMAAGRMARRADGADRLALRDGAAAYVEGRLVSVRGREAAAVVDDGDVAVAVHPTCVDDRARGGRVDRGPAGSSDVDTFVHAAPTPAEAARDRAADRPDQATGGGRPAGARGPIRGTLDLGGDGGARRLHRLEILLVIMTLLLAVPRGRQRRLLREERCTRSPLLLGLLRENRGGVRDLRLRRGGLLLGQPHLSLKPLDRVCDPLVLLPDGAEVIELLEQVGEGLGLQKDLELAGLVALVELNEALLEPALRDRVLLGQAPKRGGLLAQTCLEASQAAPMRREVPLERRELVAEDRDVAAERVDPRGRI